MVPALMIELPPTLSWLPPMATVLPLASCRSPTVKLPSRLTVLVPSTMQTLVLLLFGTVAGFQFPAVPHTPLLPRDQVVGLVNVHVAARAGLMPPVATMIASNPPRRPLSLRFDSLSI